MYSESLGLWYLVAVSVIFSSASANICNLYNVSTPSRQSLSVHKLDDLKVLDAGCTILDGGIFIEADYSGAFILGGIINITQGIYAFDGAQYLTSVEVNDLEYISMIDIENAPQLRNISFSKLSYVDDLRILGVDQITLEFPSLANSSLVSIQGNISRMDFSSLANAQSELIVTNILNGLDLPAIGLDPGSTSTYEPLAISFPSLQNASHVTLSGNISQIDMPLLTTIIPDSSGTSMMTVAAYNISLNISLPSLQTVTNLFLDGTLESISLPSLHNSGQISIYSSSSLFVDLSSLANASNIFLTGQISGGSFSSLESIGDLWINSNHELDCSPINSTYQKAHAHVAWGSFVCKQPAKARQKLSRGAKIGWGVGLGASGFFGLLFLGELIRRKRTRPRTSKGAGHELGTMGAAAPPVYSSRAGTEVGSLRDFEMTADDDGVSVLSEGTVSPEIRDRSSIISERPVSPVSQILERVEDRTIR